MTETSHSRAVAGGRPRRLSIRRHRLVRLNTAATVGTAAVTFLLGAVGLLVGVLPLHNDLLTIIVGVIVGCSAVGLSILYILAANRDPQRKLAGYVRRFEDGPPGKVVLRHDAEGSHTLIDDLERMLLEKKRLVVRLHGKDVLDPAPGIAKDAMPLYIQCPVIVKAIGSQLEEHRGLDELAERAAERLLRQSQLKGDPEVLPGDLRKAVAKTLQDWVADEFAPLVDVRRKEDLERPSGQWLTGLFEDVKCTYGVYYTQEEHDPGIPPKERMIPQGKRAWWYVSERLDLLAEEDVSAVFEPLCDAVGDSEELDRDLLDIHCAVIIAAARFGELAEALNRLRSPDWPLPSTPEAREEVAAVAVRWLVDRKTVHIGHTARDVTGAFDRLAVIGAVPPEMFGELTRDLGLDAKASKELYDWLRDDVFPLVKVVESTDTGISLVGKISDAALRWLRYHEQSAAYQDAQISAEHYYRVHLVLDRMRLPASGDAELVDGYGGLHLYEFPEWWWDVYTWGGYAAEIASPEDRKDAGVAITCLFLETWWWWGDQLRLGSVDKVLGLARKILHDQPEWISALEEFDNNYVPELDQRAGATDCWRHVANALHSISDNLGLRQGDVPPDPVMARIYVCWCFFSGDVTQNAGDLEAADEWFRRAAEACGDDPENRAMRAFASYQQADVWIPSDTDRSMRVITQTGLADEAVQLDDLSLRAYVARMFGDIRWDSGDGDIRWDSGDIGGAFDAYGRALLLTYVYQVDQEWKGQPPNEYSSALYNEMRTRFQRRLSDAREKGHASEASAAIKRIRTLFGPYWELKRAAAASGEDPLASVVPPLPARAVLGALHSEYAEDVRLMLDKLEDQVAESVDQPLREPEEERDAQPG